MKSGLARANKGEQEITNAVEEMVLEMTPLISKRMAWLPTLASLATMLGLLGTIIGMIEAFAAVAKAARTKAGNARRRDRYCDEHDRFRSDGRNSRRCS